MTELKIIALTHKNLKIEQIGQFHIDDDNYLPVLSDLKTKTGVEELMFISTCNRVEFVFVNDAQLDATFVRHFLHLFNSSLNNDILDEVSAVAELYEGESAVRHLFNVASSLDSLVVGEREIITQVRNWYEKSKTAGLSGDRIRLLTQRAITTAKEVYTHTQISNKPVSVVSLAYRKLKDLRVHENARFLIVGAGQTNTLMAKFLKKHKFNNFRIFNRTLPAAEQLAKELNGEAFALSRLADEGKDFDVIITCTAATENIITTEIYQSIVNGDSSKKIIIDLSVPHDVAPDVVKNYPVNFIDVSYLQELANENLQERKKEIEACNSIISEKIDEFRQDYRIREVERAMKVVPEQVKAIREKALQEVFAKDLDELDPRSKEVLDKIVAYMEKKFISVPMKMAKEILVK
jgi:glutamyl-tRNA reductase